MIDRSGVLEWLESNGGPLILLSEELVKAWEGIDPPSGGRVVEAQFRWSDPNVPATDYDRACDVNDYLGLLEVGRGVGLVFGDMPMRTAWQPVAESKGGIFIRWMYAENEATAIRSLLTVPDQDWEESGLAFTVGTSPLYLFDSAATGNDLSEEEYLVITIAQGKYQIETAVYQPDGKTSLLLHRFTPEPQTQGK